MLADAKAFLVNHKGPVLISFQGDCTPAKTRFRARVEVAGVTVERSGRQTTELLMTYATICGYKGDNIEIIALTKEPLDAATTTAWQYFLSFRSLLPAEIFVRLGRLTWHHTAFDRAGFGATTRLVEQYHNSYASSVFQSEADKLRCSLYNMDISTGCCLHDAAGGIRWASKTLTPNGTEEAKGFLKNLHVAIAAQRNALDIIILNVTSHVDSVIWEPSPDAKEDVLKVWKCLDITDAVAEELAFLNPRRVNGRLFCNSEVLEAWSEPKQKTAGLFMFIWRFKNFTESRFGSVGPCLRTLVASLLIGTDWYIGRLLATKAIRKHFLSGFKKLTPAHRMYAVVIGLASTVPERVIMSFMKDDRLGRRASYYSELLHVQMAALSETPDFVFERLHTALENSGWSLRELQGRCVGAAEIACGYMDRRIFHELRSKPWSLAQGDVSANLKMLAEEGPQSHPSAEKLRILVRAKWPLDDLVRHVELLRNVRWSTLKVEQLHGSSAVVKKYHPMLTPEPLQLRSFLHFTAPLFRDAKVDPVLRRFNLKLGSLEKKQPMKITATSIMVRDTNAAADATLGLTRQKSFNQAKVLLKTAARSWSTLSREARNSYAAIAQLARQEESKALAEEIEKTRALRKDRLLVLEEEQKGRGPPVGTNEDLRFTAARKERLETAYASPQFSREIVAVLREQAAKPLIQAEQGVRLARGMQSQAFYKRAWETPSRKEWLGPVTRLRGELANVAFRFGDEATGEWLLFVYAMQMPRTATFLKLKTVPPFEMPGQTDLYMSMLVGHLKMEFDFACEDLLGFVHDWDLPDMDEYELMVLPGVHRVSDGYYGTKNSPMTFRAFVDTFGNRPKGEEDAEDQKEKGEAEIVLREEEKRPWLKAHKLRKAGVLPPRDAKRPRLPDPEPMPLDEDQLRDIEKSTEQLREEWRASHGALVDALQHFEVEHRGGEWTEEHIGVNCDSCRGRACSVYGQEMLERWGMQNTWGCHFSKYGQETAELLVLGWCHKMAYYAECWLSMDQSSTFAFHGGHHSGYRELEELAAEAATWVPGSDASKRLADLRAFQPHGPALY